MDSILESKLDGNRFCDRLSNLPTEILHHILLLLPFEDTVRTSVLSTRWKYAWASIPTLRFDESDFLTKNDETLNPENDASGRRTLFMNFVERAFAHRGQASLEALTLCCDVWEDESRIKDWIAGSVRSDVQDISLSFNWSTDSFEYPEDIFTQETKAKELHTLPDCLFQSQKLGRLGIRMRSPYYILKLPSSIGFSCLKELNLSCIMFLDDTTELFACPLLEIVSISVCSSKNLQVFHVNAPKLQHFSIRDSLIHQELRIDGTCLKSFYYVGDLGNRCCISGSPVGIVKAELAVPYHYESWCKRDSVANNGCELLNSLSMVKKLSLYDNFIEYLQRKEDLFAALPVFNHLTKLVFWGVDAGLNCSSLFTILRKCPRLGTLKFCGGLKEFRRGVWEELFEPLPLCFQTDLKKIVVKFFENSLEEEFILLMLLRASVVLEEVVIDSCCGEEENEEFKNLVKMLRNRFNLRVTYSSDNE